ncbi:MAG: hypothetical protein IT305_31240 [Chloroflexi bacterium]|nr:hypothetical protein [Chloroflexota bacterium]
MKSSLVLAAGILLVLGIFFARDRLKFAFKVGAVLYAVSLVARFFLFGATDPDNLLDIAIIAAVFFGIWAVGWLATHLTLRYRSRRAATEGPSASPPGRWPGRWRRR